MDEIMKHTPPYESVAISMQNMNYSNYDPTIAEMTSFSRFGIGASMNKKGWE